MLARAKVPPTPGNKVTVRGGDLDRSPLLAGLLVSRSSQLDLGISSCGVRPSGIIPRPSCKLGVFTGFFTELGRVGAHAIGRYDMQVAR